MHLSARKLVNISKVTPRPNLRHLTRPLLGHTSFAVVSLSLTSRRRMLTKCSPACQHKVVLTHPLISSSSAFFALSEKCSPDAFRHLLPVLRNLSSTRACASFNPKGQKSSLRQFASKWLAIRLKNRLTSIGYRNRGRLLKPSSCLFSPNRCSVMPCQRHRFRYESPIP